VCTTCLELITQNTAQDMVFVLLKRHTVPQYPGGTLSLAHTGLVVAESSCSPSSGSPNCLNTPVETTSKRHTSHDVPEPQELLLVCYNYPSNCPCVNEVCGLQDGSRSDVADAVTSHPLRHSGFAPLSFTFCRLQQKEKNRAIIRGHIRLPARVFALERKRRAAV
jgi:hypothetical protein